MGAAICNSFKADEVFASLYHATFQLWLDLTVTGHSPRFSLFLFRQDWLSWSLQQHFSLVKERFQVCYVIRWELDLLSILTVRFAMTILTVEIVLFRANREDGSTGFGWFYGPYRHAPVHISVLLVIDGQWCLHVFIDGWLANMIWSNATSMKHAVALVSDTSWLCHRSVPRRKPS